jgi:hypothetical protein
MLFGRAIVLYVNITKHYSFKNPLSRGKLRGKEEKEVMTTDLVSAKIVWSYKGKR